MLVSAGGTPVESACRESFVTSLGPASGLPWQRELPSLRLIEQATKFRLIEQACGCFTVRGGGRLKVRARLGRWHSDGECLPLVVRHQGPAGGIVFAMEAAMKLRLIAQAMKLRLIKQACGCFTVGGGGRLKVRAGLCGWHSGGECLP